MNEKRVHRFVISKECVKIGQYMIICDFQAFIIFNDISV